MVNRLAAAGQPLVTPFVCPSPRDPGESGGTGRRAGFRIQWGNLWGFESPLSHSVGFDSDSMAR